MIKVYQSLILVFGVFLGTGSGAGSVCSTEVFDDGFETIQVSGPDSTVYYRITQLELRDPHLFGQLLSCSDLTDGNPFGFPSFNFTIDQDMITDSDGDGLLDQSLVVATRPLNQSCQVAELDIYQPDCIDPVSTTVCSVSDPGQLIASTTYQASDQAVCLAPLPGTTSSYIPALVSPSSACFRTQPSSMTIDLAGMAIPLIDARLGATFPSDPAIDLNNGLLYGFLLRSAADQIFFPLDYPVISGVSLGEVLAGGTPNCSFNDDTDTHDDQSGWWMYFNFSAQQVQVAGG
jgi:hypothetical protein